MVVAMVVFEKLKNGVIDFVKFMKDIKHANKDSICNSILNLFEEMAAKLKASEEEIQKLKDEVNELKGEQGKPEIRENKKQNKNDDDTNNDSSNHSSEKERKNRKKKKGKKSKEKKNKIKIDKKIKLDIDKKNLPEDAIFKRYETVVKQDIKIITNNIEFIRAVYYSSSLKKTFMAPLPEEYSKGEFGASLRALVLSLYNDAEMTQPKIYSFLKTVGILISKATISRMLINDHDVFHQEKKDILKAGLESTDYQHLDDTSARVNGKNQYCHVLCNEYYTFYATYPHKDRLSVIRALTQGDVIFSLCDETFLLMEELKLAQKHLVFIQQKQGEFTESEIDAILNNLFPNVKDHNKIHSIIKDAAAIVAYRKRDDSILHLVVDDAPQFKKIAEIALCWIHEGRHYKKINPLFAPHKIKLAEFLESFWDYYHELKDYKENPTEKTKKELDTKFDVLFSTKTGYEFLDNRIARTMEKKKALLQVLEYPEVPLHNNPAELGARTQTRKRDIHLYTKNAKGTKAKDSFATIVQTARKLEVNIYDYFFDRISGKYKMPSLAAIIGGKSSMVTVLP